MKHDYKSRRHGAGEMQVILDMIDRGSGIPPENRAELFLPFFATKKAGTALGLPIAKKIIESHRGRIEVLDNSPSGALSRVRIRVPPGRETRESSRALLQESSLSFR
jgi:nitrogen fixation/metabolism regulation signal transduction histidine kinase